MHPREGWTEDRRPYGLSRRGFFKQSAAAALLLGGASSLLEACSSSGTTGTANTSAGGIPLPRPDSGRIENAWAVHQAESSVNFARRSRVIGWLLGGLNFQIEHHLFPRISHVNYPAMCQQTARCIGNPAPSPYPCCADLAR